MEKFPIVAGLSLVFRSPWLVAIYLQNQTSYWCETFTRVFNRPLPEPFLLILSGIGWGEAMKGR